METIPISFESIKPARKTAMFGSVLDWKDVERRHPGEKHACFTQFRKEAVREYITESPTGISIVCPVGASQ